MLPHAALTALATKTTTAAILPGGCHYPPQPAPAPRSGQVVWDAFVLEQVADQTWLMRPALYLIAPRLNESTYDTAAVDGLVYKLADLFSPHNPDAYHLETAGDHVDFCRVAEGRREAFAGWYAFRVDFAVKLRRFPA